MNGSFSRFCGKYISFHTNDVANVEQFFPNLVIQRLVFSRANLISFYINLNFSCTILYHRKRSFTHIADTHNTSGKADFSKFSFILFSFIICLYLS